METKTYQTIKELLNQRNYTIAEETEDKII